MTRKCTRGPRDNTDRYAALDRLYAQLPTIECRGKCWDSCGPIAMTRVEERRLADAGHPVPNHDLEGGLPAEPMVCPTLTMFNSCAAYELRPMICRLWGLVANMPCEYGCVPAGGHLTVAAGYEFLALAAEIDGRPDVAAAMRAPFATPALTAQSTAIALALNRRLHDDYNDHVAAVEASRGPTLYVLGRGRYTTTRPAP